MFNRITSFLKMESNGYDFLAFDPMDSDTWDNVGNHEIDECYDPYTEQFDESQAQHKLNSYQNNQNEEETSEEEETNEEEEECVYDCNIFSNLNESKKWFESIGIHPKKLSKLRQRGLIVIPIQYYSLLRNTTAKSCRPCPHVIVLPQSEDFEKDHIDFSTAITALY